MTDDFSEYYERFMALHQSPVIQNYLRHTNTILGYDLPQRFSGPLKTYNQIYYSTPRPAFSTEAEDNKGLSKWQSIHSVAIFDSLSAGLSAVSYHYDNLLELERKVLAFPALQDLVQALKDTNSTLGGGNTMRLDAEYAAFVLAYRRTLEYLTRGLAALLKNDFHSFRGLPVFLERQVKKHPWCNPILEVLSKYDHVLQTFKSEPRIGHESVRDRLSHYSHVTAGVINVNQFGIFLAGGGENLKHTERLGDVLNKYMDALEQIVVVFLSAMAEGIKTQK